MAMLAVTVTVETEIPDHVYDGILANLKEGFARELERNDLKGVISDRPGISEEAGDILNQGGEPDSGDAVIDLGTRQAPRTARSAPDATTET